jgi:hypothetical protein
MKKFLYNVLLFVAPLLVLGCCIDFVISTNIKKSNSHAMKEYPTWNAILDGNLNAEILIYGSSRAWVHFDSKLIEDSLRHPVYNLGMNGHTFNMQYLRHILALKHNPKPKLIIHSVDIGTLSKGSLYNPDQFLPYMLWSKPFYKYMSNYEGYSSFDYRIPLVRYYGKTDAIKTAIQMLLSPETNVVERVKGYQGQKRAWNNDFDNAKKEMKQYVVTPDSLTLSAFEAYLIDCKKQGIEVVLVYSPYYIEGQEFISNQSQIIDLYKTLAHRQDFSFLDFTNDEICFDKKYFYNASHMNTLGAELFSRKLCTQIRSTNAQRAFRSMAGGSRN